MPGQLSDGRGAPRKLSGGACGGPRNELWPSQKRPRRRQTLSKSRSRRERPKGGHRPRRPPAAGQAVLRLRRVRTESGELCQGGAQYAR